MLGTSPAGSHACGADVGGYLAGQHPRPADGMVQRTVCWSFNGNTCWQTSSVQVVACDGFYLYNLAAPPSACAVVAAFF